MAHQRRRWGSRRGPLLLAGRCESVHEPHRRIRHRPAAGEAAGARQSETRSFSCVMQNHLTRHRDEPKGEEYKWGFWSPILGWCGLYLPKAGSSQDSLSLRRPVLEFEKEMLNLWTPAAPMNNIRPRDTLFNGCRLPRPRCLAAANVKLLGTKASSSWASEKSHKYMFRGEKSTKSKIN